jgi:hypothetical protein
VPARTDAAPDDPLSMDPRTRDDFESLSAALADLIVSKHGGKPLYAAFVEHHVKALCAPLRDLETRKASSALATLANEKQRVAKDAQGGKKKTKAAAKPALGAAKQNAKVDTSSYHEALDDDFDDFVGYIALVREGTRADMMTVLCRCSQVETYPSYSTYPTVCLLAIDHALCGNISLYGTHWRYGTSTAGFSLSRHRSQSRLYLSHSKHCPCQQMTSLAAPLSFPVCSRCCCRSGLTRLVNGSARSASPLPL